MMRDARRYARSRCDVEQMPMWQTLFARARSETMSEAKVPRRIVLIAKNAVAQRDKRRLLEHGIAEDVVLDAHQRPKPTATR